MVAANKLHFRWDLRVCHVDTKTIVRNVHVCHVVSPSGSPYLRRQKMRNPTLSTREKGSRPPPKSEETRRGGVVIAPPYTRTGVRNSLSSIDGATPLPRFP